MRGAEHRSILLTPASAGAIGVVRVVGPDPCTVVNQAFRSKFGKPLSTESVDRLRYGQFVDNAEVIDDVVASVTALNGCRLAVDISAHGGVRIIERILQTLERLGAPACEPFAAIQDVWPARDHIEAEAIEALCRAKTARALRFVAWQRQHLSALLGELAEKVTADQASVRDQLEAVIDRFALARTLLRGAVVAIVGPPNSGKSTLFNCLLGRPAAIVSPTAGTTRDWLAESIELDGIPVTLVDTAGRHEARDALEQLAIEAGRSVAERADVHLLVFDGTQPLPDPLRDAGKTHGIPVVLAANKSDLLARAHHAPDAAALVSAKTGEGVQALVQLLVTSLGFSSWPDEAPSFFTERQVRIARNALSRLRTDPPGTAEAIRRELLGWPDPGTSATHGR
jgi:tRNA modification GTPase